MCEASSGLMTDCRLAVQRECAADEAPRLGEERIAQAALPVEVVDRHVHERVRRQGPDRACASRRRSRGRGTTPSSRSARASGRRPPPSAASGRRCGVRSGRDVVRRGAARQAGDVHADQDGDDEHACGHGYGFARRSHRGSDISLRPGREASLVTELSFSCHPGDRPLKRRRRLLDTEPHFPRRRGDV